MAGRAHIRQYVGLTDVGHGLPISKSWTISDVDEIHHDVRSLAATTSEAIGLGSIAATAVLGVAIYLITGGVTAATGLAIDMEASTYATAHAILLQGRMHEWLPGQMLEDTPAVALAVRNLNDAACVYELLVYGEA